MKYFLIAILLLCNSWAGGYKATPKTKSVFMDEITVKGSYHQENIYGLELDSSYKLSFEVLKEEKLIPGQAYVEIYTQIISVKDKKSKVLKFVQKLGADISNDGKWHKVESKFTFAIPEGYKVKKNLLGANWVRIIVYNKNKEGAGFKIRNLSGLPKYVNYKYLGSKSQKLPQILLIGDSTMYHTYRSKVARFKNEASVYYLPVNGGHTRFSTSNIRRWVGEKQWDLIYFNSGIHDLTRRNEKGAKGNDFPNAVPEEEYANNLREIATFLKLTKAKIVWRSITPLADDVKGRTQSDEKRYNKAAASVMKDFSIPVHNVTESHRKELTKNLSDGVHFSKDGNALLAELLYQFIKERELLKK